MANELSIVTYLQYTNAAFNISQINFPATAANVAANVAGKNFSFGSQLVPTTAGGTAIPKGAIGTLGWGIFKNIDATNFIKLLTAASGTLFGRLNISEPASCFRFDQSVSAPAAIADTASALLQYLMIEN